MICPLCRKEKTIFEAHHVVWRADGGTDDKTNLLKICKTCHLTITNGDPADADQLERLCIFHQLAAHGLDFIQKSGLLTGSHSMKDKMLVALDEYTIGPETDAKIKAFFSWIVLISQGGTMEGSYE